MSAISPRGLRPSFVLETGARLAALGSIRIADARDVLQRPCREAHCYARPITAKLQRPTIFKWRHFAPEVILCAVRWYLRYSLSYREVRELLVERGLEIDHTTVWRWVQRYAPPRRWLDPSHPQPRVINTDKAQCYPSAILESKEEGILRKRCRHRPVQYLNNILEQDHRAIKKRIRAKQHFREFSCARRTIQGYETMHKIRKGQVRWLRKGDTRMQNRFIDQVFGLAA